MPPGLAEELSLEFVAFADLDPATSSFMCSIRVDDENAITATSSSFSIDRMKRAAAFLAAWIGSPAIEPEVSSTMTTLECFFTRCHSSFDRRKVASDT